MQAYQLYRARECGADAVLLIAAVLPNSDLALLIKVARTLGLQCLIEVRVCAQLPATIVDQSKLSAPHHNLSICVLPRAALFR